MSITDFKKKLNEIINTNDWLNLYHKGKFVGCITLNTDDYIYTSRKKLIDAITIEKSTEYDYEANDDTEIETIRIWVEFSNNGYCFYEFDEYSVGSV